MKNKILTLKIGLLLVFLTNTLLLNAGIVHPVKRIESDAQYNIQVVIGEVEATTLVEANPISGNTFYDKKVSNRITFGVNQNYNTYFSQTQFVEVKIHLKKWNQTNQLTEEDVNLTINYTTNPNEIYVPQTQYDFENIYIIETTLTEIKVNGINVNTLPENLFIESEIFIERYFEFQTATTELIVNSPIYVSATNELQLSWPSCYGAEEYQVEWIYLNDYSKLLNTSRSQASIAYDFINNSTRISTSNTSYNIPLLYDKGYVIFRVRGVGVDIFDLSNLDIPIFGKWSLMEDKGFLNDVSSDFKYKILFNAQHEKNLNWQAETTYAEEGKRKDVVTYFDGSLRSRQTVTKINTNEIVIAGETIYDHQGRPAINVLPTPTTENSINFKPKLNRNLANESYTKLDFDLTPEGENCTSPVVGMKPNSGASLYYSANNLNQINQQSYVPKAFNYPFSQVEYTPDNTGRINRQSGVGPEFQLGSEHETFYIYGQANQVEIDRLFGSEVGNADHYKKNTVIDAQKQASISYLDMEGRVIATSLAGDSPDVFVPLDDEILNATQLTVSAFGNNNLQNKITIEGNGIEFNSQIAVSYASDYVINYDIIIDPFKDECLAEDVCIDCVYDLEISFLDECGTNLVTLNANDKIIGKFIVNANNTYSFHGVCTNESNIHETPLNSYMIPNLKAGSYQLSKKLTIRADAIDAYIDYYLEHASDLCLKTLDEFQAEEIANIDTSLCDVTCESCLTTLGSLEDYIANGYGDENDYNLEKSNCNLICNEGEEFCETVKKQMIGDMIPGGQYAEYHQNDDGTIDFTGFPLSVLFEDNKLPVNFCLVPDNLFVPSPINTLLAALFFQEQALPILDNNWRKPHVTIGNVDQFEYQEDTGERSIIELTLFDDGSYQPAVLDLNLIYTNEAGVKFIYPENLANVKDFISLFKISWAKSLLVYHPEYEYYKTCIQYAKKIDPYDNYTSESFDFDLRKITSFQEAVDEGFLVANGTGGYSIDHWFVRPTNGDLRPWDPACSMGGEVNTIEGITYTNSYADPFNYNSIGTCNGSYSARLMHRTKHYEMVNDETVARPMTEISAMISRCATDIGIIDDVACFAFGTSDANTTTLILDKEWSTLKSFYLSVKGELQRERMDCHVKTTFKSNACIGDSDFNPITEGTLLDISNITSPVAAIYGFQHSPYFLNCTTCNDVTKDYYETKIPRFGGMKMLPTQSVEQIALMYYQQTGQCPMTLAFQTMLTKLTSLNLLDNSNVDLNLYVELASIFVALNDMENPGPMPDLTQQVTLNNGNPNSLLISWIQNNPPPVQNFASFTLKKEEFVMIDGQAVDVPWDEIIEITSVHSIDDNGNFTALGVFEIEIDNPEDDNVNGAQTIIVKRVIELIGTLTGLNIKDCEFEKTCTFNDLALDLTILMNYLAPINYIADNLAVNINNLLITTDPNETAIDLGTLVIENAADVGTDLNFIYNESEHQFIIYNTNTGQDQGLFIEYSAVSPTSYDLDVLNTIVSFEVMIATGINTFDQVAYLANGTEITLSGSVYRKNEAGVKFRIRVGECEYPMPFGCEGEAYVLFEEVQDLIQEIFLEQDFTSPTFLVENCVNFNGLIAEKFPIGTATNFTFTNSNDLFTNNFEMEGGDCYMRLFNSGEGKNAHSFEDLIAIENFQILQTPVVSPEPYEFYFTGIFSSNGGTFSDLIYVHAPCFVLKECGECEEPLYDTEAYPDPTNTSGTGVVPCGANENTDLNIECPIEYQHYTEVYANYTLWAQGNEGFTLPTLKSSTQFFQEGLCSCIDQFADILEGVKLHLYNVNSQFQFEQLINFTTFCSPPEVVCDDNIITEMPYEAPEVELNNDCILMAQYQAIMAAQNSYNLYLDSLKTALTNRYLANCIHPLEKLDYTYQDKSYHYTLYYYDQAGNLIKTVPPEGVEVLPFTSSYDPLSVSIANDRMNHTKNVFTNHRMTTNYEYNSLNQLVAQATPDTDPMTVFDLTLPNGLDPLLQTKQIQMLNEQQGYLAGNISNSSMMYRTDDGGNTWTEINNSLGSDLQKIQMLTNNLGFAIGTEGTLLWTRTSGINWHQLRTWMVGNINNGFIKNIKDFLFVSTSTNNYVGLFVGENNLIVKTSVINVNDNVSLNTMSYNFINTTAIGSPTITATSTITSVSADNLNFYITVNDDFGKSLIYKKLINANNNVGWELESGLSVSNLNDIEEVENGLAYACGNDGRLYQNTNAFSTVSTPPYWEMLPTSLSFPIKAIEFFDANKGVALMETEINVLRLMRTADAGLTWKQVSDGEFYGLEKSEDKTLIVAFGKNANIEIVVDMEDLPYENISITLSNIPATNEALLITGAWLEKLPQVNGSSKVKMMVSSKDDLGQNKIHYTNDAFEFEPTWLEAGLSLPSNEIVENIKAKYFITQQTIVGSYTTNLGNLKGFKIDCANLVTPYQQFSDFAPSGSKFKAIDLVVNSGVYKLVSIDQNSASVYVIPIVGNANSLSASVVSGGTASYLTAASTNQIIGKNATFVAISSDGKIQGFSLTSSLSAFATTNPSINHSLRFKALPLERIEVYNNKIFAIGRSGVLFVKDNNNATNAWKLQTTGFKNDLYALIASTSQYIVGGAKGLLNYGTFNGTSFESETFMSQHDRLITDEFAVHNIYDLGIKNNQFYAVGSAGLVLRAANLSSSNTLFSTIVSDKDLHGLAFENTANNIFIVGNSSSMFQMTGLTSFQMATLNIYPLFDFHFYDVNNGIIVGDKFTIRITNDGGLTWKCVKPARVVGGVLELMQRAPNVDFSVCWNVDGQFAFALGERKFVVENDLAFEVLNLPAGTVTAITKQKVGNSYYVANQVNPGTNQVYVMDFVAAGLTTSVFSSTFVATTANNKINSIHSFANQSYMLTGENSLLKYFDANNVEIAGINGGIPNNITFNRVLFSDRTNGYLVGDDGNFYKTDLNSQGLTGDGFLTATSWTKYEQVNENDPYNVYDNTVVSMTNKPDIKAIAFGKVTNPIYGGSYKSSVYNNGVILANLSHPLVRNLYDPNSRYSQRFYYDRLGRLVVSQNSRQFANMEIINNQNVRRAKYSYTLYDGLGRVVEVGEKTENGNLQNRFNAIFGTYVADYYTPTTIDDAKLESWILGGGARKEVTKSYYDKTLLALPNNANFDENTQRKRIIHVTYEEVFDNDDYTFDHATHYNYDIHGNVKTLIQDNQKMATAYPSLATQEMKRIDYQYDLVSGNVHRVSVQNGAKDQWHHAYLYDADNRITETFTTKDTPRIKSSIFSALLQNEMDYNKDWENDARYFYYDHGPLARVELGENSVQGVDYVYNLQGWLKGVNSVSLRAGRDPGRDAATTGTNKFFARDVFGFGLDYFVGDYAPINDNKAGINGFQALKDIATADLENYNLYNGNIRSMQTTITDPNTGVALPMANVYAFDQLNRIKESKSFTAINVSNNEWTYDVSAYNNSYYNAFSFDRNGNILTQKRHLADGTQIEDMSYRYHTQNGKTLKNRLYHVNDAITESVATDDIDDQGIFVGVDNAGIINGDNNYVFDQEGRLIQEKNDEIEKIIWRVDGKVKEVIRTQGSLKNNLKYDYDAMGNRVAKHIYDNQFGLLQKSEYYVLDAQGNIMNEYWHKVEIENTAKYFLADQHLYGSSRLGTRKNLENLLEETADLPIKQSLLGQKQYHLSNHLGNVLSVVSDRKYPQTLDNVTISGFTADILNARDYSPFGVILDGRNFKKEVCEDEIISSQILTDENSTFDNSTNNYTAQNNFTSANQNSGLLKIHRYSSSPANNNTVSKLSVEKSFAVSQAGTSYTLTFDFAKSNNFNSSVEVFIDGNSINTFSNTNLYSFTLADLVAGTHNIRFESVNTFTGATNSNKYFTLDNVKITHLFVEITVNCFDVETVVYGFNGMRMDNEFNDLEGGTYDFGARLFDPLLGRWKTRDKLERKFTSFSTYSAFANSPLIFNDPDGKDLIITGKTEVALKDIRSLVPEEYRSLIEVEENGKIKFDINKLPDEVKSYKGVSLLNDLTKPGKNYQYKVGDELIGTDRETGITYNNQLANEGILKDSPTAEGSIFNFSKTERTDIKNSHQANSIPEEGFDGSVLIQDGEFTRANPMTGNGEFPIERNTIVFHELLENKLRTEDKKDYKGRNGAHQGASDKGDKFSREVNNKPDKKHAGTATGFKKNKL